MVEKKQKAETNEWIKVWLIMSYLIVLFYMYAYYTGGKTAREIPIEAHLQKAKGKDAQAVWQGTVILSLPSN